MNKKYEIEPKIQTKCGEKRTIFGKNGRIGTTENMSEVLLSDTLKIQTSTDESSERIVSLITNNRTTCQNEDTTEIYKNLSNIPKITKQFPKIGKLNRSSLLHSSPFKEINHENIVGKEKHNDEDYDYGYNDDNNITNNTNNSSNLSIDGKNVPTEYYDEEDRYSNTPVRPTCR